MKRFIPTILLVVVCVAGFWYAKSESLFKEKPAEVKSLVTVKAEDVQSFSFGTGDDAIQLTRKGDSWEMNKPKAYPVSKIDADSWASSFASLTFESKVNENAQDLAEYGLDKPAMEFDVKAKDGSVKKLLIGTALPVAGTTYVKMGDSPIVYEAKDESLQSLAKQSFDFVDKSAVSIDYNKTTTVALDWKGQKWQLDKTDKDKNAYEAKWKIGNKELPPEDGSAIMDQLVALQSDQLPKAASEVKTDASELIIDVKTTAGGKESAKTILGKVDGDHVWIVEQGAAWAYSVPAASLQQVYDIGVTKRDQPAPSPSPSAATSPAASASPAPAK